MAAAGVLSPSLAQAANFVKKSYGKVKLVDASGAPIKASAVPTDQALVFHYPLASTPAFLINLGESVAGEKVNAEDGKNYDWEGGVGPKKAVVAYSAICSHVYAHPEKNMSMIAYDPKSTATSGQAKCIVCCVHGSVYDATKGAKVLHGPAPHPLASIVLEHDASDDSLYATEMIGSSAIHDMFAAYKMDLIKEYGAANLNKQVTGSVKTIPLSEFSKSVITC
jgi:Rieske Fe-S protein